jgi:hypothetical protein
VVEIPEDDQLNQTMMQIEYGKTNRMTVTVNELEENTIYANGQ